MIFFSVTRGIKTIFSVTREIKTFFDIAIGIKFFCVGVEGVPM